MANSVDPDQLASSEANWSGSALFAKAGLGLRCSGNATITEHSQHTQPTNYTKTNYHIYSKIFRTPQLLTILVLKSEQVEVNLTTY